MFPNSSQVHPPPHGPPRRWFGVPDLVDRAEHSSHAEEQHLDQVLEPQQLLAEIHPGGPLTSLTGVEQSKGAPLVLEHQRHPEVEEAPRHTPRAGSRQRQVGDPVGRFDPDLDSGFPLLPVPLQGGTYIVVPLWTTMLETALSEFLMVNIIVPKYRPFSALAAGLTGREVSRAGQVPRFLFVEDADVPNLWKNPASYADEEDHAVIIVGVRPPSKQEAEGLPPVDAGVIVTYIPVRETSSARTLEFVRKRGAFVAPPRRLADCYLGDPATVAIEWKALARLLLLESKTSTVSRQQERLLDGFLRAYFRNPGEAAAMVQRNEIGELEGLSTPAAERIRIVNLGKAVRVKGSRESQSTVAVRGVVVYYRIRRQPILLDGREPAVFTTMPTLGTELLREMHLPTKTYRFGPGGLVQFRGAVSEEKLLLFAGQLARERVPILLTSSGDYTEKTLRRRIVGGRTKERKGLRTYEKLYRSMKDSHPDVEMNGKLIQAGQDSFEPVVRLLRSSGAEFRILR